MIPLPNFTRAFWRLRDVMVPHDDSRPDPTDDDSCDPGEADRCGSERVHADRMVSLPILNRQLFPIEDLEREAEHAVYSHNGLNKRHRYPRADLRSRYVVIVLHQTAVERSSSNPRWPLVTAHRAIKPDGTRVKLHPLNVRLTAANRLDRAPFHAISIEVGGNFEGIDGDNDWWKPSIYGRGRASDRQIQATRSEIRAICAEVATDYDAHVAAIVPHRISGHDPSKDKCPGSRVWSECGEWAGATLGLAIPASQCTFGGLPIPIQWRGPYWLRCDVKLPKGFWPR